MSVTYAGVTLPTVTGEAAATLEKYISPADLYPWADQITGMTRINWTIQGAPVWQRPVKVGSLYWPTGASRWAVGYFLVDQSSLQSIRSKVASGAAPLVISDRTNTITASMYMLPPHPLFGALGNTQLWLLILVDQRYFLWERDTGVSFNPNTVTSWSNLYSQAATAGGLTISVDSINANYLNASPALAAYGERLPPYLDTIAYNVGQRLVFALNGKVSAWNYATSATQYTFNKTPTQFLAGGELQVGATGGSILPQSLTVQFPVVWRPYGTTGWSYAPFDTSETVNDSGLIQQYQRLSVAASSLNLPAGLVFGSTTANVRTTAQAGMTGALRTGSSFWTWDNQTECQNLAKQIATDWYKYQTSAADLVYSGIVNWIPEGLSDSIEWTYQEDMVCTRIQRPPYNDPAENLYHRSSVTGVSYPAAGQVQITSATPQTISLLDNTTKKVVYAGQMAYSPGFTTNEATLNQSPVWLVMGGPDAGNKSVLVGSQYFATYVGDDYYGQRIYQCDPSQGLGQVTVSSVPHTPPVVTLAGGGTVNAYAGTYAGGSCWIEAEWNSLFTVTSYPSTSGSVWTPPRAGWVYQCRQVDVDASGLPVFRMASWPTASVTIDGSTGVITGNPGGVGLGDQSFYGAKTILGNVVNVSGTYQFGNTVSLLVDNSTSAGLSMVLNYQGSTSYDQVILGESSGILTFSIGRPAGTGWIFSTSSGNGLTINDVTINGGTSPSANFLLGNITAGGVQSSGLSITENVSPTRSSPVGLTINATKTAGGIIWTDNQTTQNQGWIQYSGNYNPPSSYNTITIGVSPDPTWFGGAPAFSQITLTQRGIFLPGPLTLTNTGATGPSSFQSVAGPYSFLAYDGSQWWNVGVGEGIIYSMLTVTPPTFGMTGTIGG